MATNKQSQRERDLLRTFSKDYEPESWWGLFTYQSRMPFFTIRYVHDMMQDSRIKLGMKIIKGPILSLSRFYINDPLSKPDRPSPLKEFLIKQITRFWRFHAVKALTAIEWGFHGSEVLYKLHRDSIEFNGLRPFRPNDVRPLTLDGEKVGISVRNFRSQQATNSKTGKLYLGGPKGFWHVYQREEHPWFGRSCLFGAFKPWIEFYSDGGAKDIRRLYYHKFAFRGDTLYYPDGDAPSTEAGPEGTGQSARSYKSMAREMLSKIKSGGMCMFPSRRDEAGELEWQIQGPQSGPGNADILDYHEQLKQELFEGLGIPPEVVDAAEVGSGWSGRKIPQQGFYMTLQETVNWLMHDFDQQVLRELCTLNGFDSTDYEIIPFGLLQEDGEGEAESIQANKGAASASEDPGGNISNIPGSARRNAQFSIAV